MHLLEAGTAELARVYVAPRARRGGLGGRLLAAAERAAAGTLRAGRLRLDTRDDLVEAQAMYRRHGYAEIPATTTCRTRTASSRSGSPLDADAAVEADVCSSWLGRRGVRPPQRHLDQAGVDQVEPVEERQDLVVSADVQGGGGRFW